MIILIVNKLFAHLLNYTKHKEECAYFLHKNCIIINHLQEWPRSVQVRLDLLKTQLEEKTLLLFVSPKSVYKALCILSSYHILVSKRRKEEEKMGES